MHDLQVQLNNAMQTVSGVKLEDRVEVSDLLLQVGIPSVNQLAAETTLLETWRQINLGSSLWNMAPAAFRHETDLNKAKQIAKTFCSSLPSF